MDVAAAAGKPSSRAARCSSSAAAVARATGSGVPPSSAWACLQLEQALGPVAEVEECPAVGASQGEAEDGILRGRRRSAMPSAAASSALRRVRRA